MKKCKLSDIAIIVAGQSPKSEYYTFNNLDTPFLQGNRTFGDKYPYIDTYTKKVTKLAPKNSILMSVRAPVGDLNIATEDCCIGRGLCSINAINGDNEFLYYLLKHNIKSIINQGNGTTYDAINKEQLESLEIQLPSENEDDLKKISNLLSVLDYKIQNNNKINAELESMAKTIYDYWFLQFEFPNEEGKPYKSSGGKMIWNEELRREIPEGWDVKGIDEFGMLKNGINYDKESQGDKKYRIVNVKNISSTSLLIDNEELDNIVLCSKNANKYLLSDKDILIARSGTPGSVRILNSGFTNTIFCGFIICLSLSNKLYKEFIVYRLKDYENTSATTSGGTILQNVSQDVLKKIKFYVPNKELIIKFNKKINTIWNLMQNNILENRQLLTIRDSLLPLLMNGQVGFKEDISIKEIEVDSEEVFASLNEK